MENYCKALIGRTLSIPAGACGRRWALQEFKEIAANPLTHPLEAKVVGYAEQPDDGPHHGSQKASGKGTFRVRFLYDGEEYDKPLRFIKEYLVGKLPDVPRMSASPAMAHHRTAKAAPTKAPPGKVAPAKAPPAKAASAKAPAERKRKASQAAQRSRPPKQKTLKAKRKPALFKQEVGVLNGKPLIVEVSSTALTTEEKTHADFDYDFKEYRSDGDYGVAFSGSVHGVVMTAGLISEFDVYVSGDCEGDAEVEGAINFSEDWASQMCQRLKDDIECAVVDFVSEDVDRRNDFHKESSSSEEDPLDEWL